MPLGMEVGLGLRDIVFDVDPATPRKRHTHPTQFLARVYCGKTAAWIKMALGMEVSLDPSDTVNYRWGPSFPSPKRGHSP